MTDKPNVLLVSIDTQVDFMMADGRLPVPGAEALIVPGIRYLASLDRSEIRGVLFTYDTHHAERYIGSPENLGDEAAGIPGFPMHCEYGTPGHANVFNQSIVHQEIPCWTLQKEVFDMWEQPSRDVRIHRHTREGEDGYEWGRDRDFFFNGHADANGNHDPMGRGTEIEGVDTVRIMGVASDFCVNWAIAGFLKRGFRVQVIEHLTAGIGMDIRATVEANFPGMVEFVR